MSGSLQIPLLGFNLHTPKEKFKSPRDGYVLESAKVGQALRSALPSRVAPPAARRHITPQNRTRMFIAAAPALHRYGALDDLSYVSERTGIEILGQPHHQGGHAASTSR